MSDSMHVTPPVRRELSVTEEVRYERGKGKGGGGRLMISCSILNLKLD